MNDDELLPTHPVEAQPLAGAGSPEESETIAALLLPYRATTVLQQRPFCDSGVRDLVLALSLIVRHHAFGNGSWATGIAQLLKESEPLEQLRADDLPCYKLRAIHLCYSQRFSEARTELERGLARYPDDPFLGETFCWLSAHLHQESLGKAGNRRADRRKRGHNPD